MTLELTLTWAEIHDLMATGFKVWVIERAPTLDELYYCEVEL